MNCDSIKNILNEYYEGKLPKPDLIRIAKHLQNCTECKKAFAQICYKDDHYSLGEKTLDRLINDYTNLNLKWET
jgi:predicted anti-sigma-YlaC factor YlaD